MSFITARLVNKGKVGEPEYIVLQNLETNTIYELSQIVGENISNNDTSHPTIQRILNGDHTVQISVDENENITLHF